LKENEDQIVKIQAAFRGHKERKSLKQHLIKNNLMLDEPGLEFKEEYVFENGAVFRGQWKKD